MQCAEPSYIYETVDLWTPNDARYSNQWGLNHIDISNAWNFSIGNTNPRIRVGIFENNIQANHEDLSVIPGNFTPDPSDSAEHGTHVAGIIGAVSDNTIGIAGIAQVDIALLDRGNFVSSIRWAINNDIRVINASFYYGYIDSSGNKILTAPSNSHAEAIENFGNAGGIFVASAGNSGNTTLGNLDNTPQYPGGYGDSRRYPNINNVITVGALNQGGGRRASSNYGVNSVHIYAPGENIISTLPGNSYGIDSGTSMAAPHVAGVAALMLSINPNISAEGLRNAILNNSETVSIQVPTVAGGTTFTSQNVRSLNAFKAVTSVAFNTSSNDNGITLEGLTNNFNFFDGSQLVLPNSFTQYGRPLASEHQNIIGIGASCFENNKVIENITLPPKVNIIGSYSFKNCRNLQIISIPNTVTNIDSSAFENCSYLQSITLPSNLVAIGSSAFKGCGSLASITIPNGVTNIDSSAFENCSYLQSVTLPTNLVAIGSSAFKGCGSLGSITIPNGVTNIDSSAFENCSYLQSVTLSTNLVTIGSSAFKSCGSLGNVTIPSNVQYIDDSAFENCVSLVSVIVEREISNITNLGNYAFAGCSSALQIIVPQNRVAEYKNKVYWSSYKNRIIANDDNFSEIELHCLSDFYNLTSLDVNYNKLYKLDVLCGKSYQIIADSNSDVKINLYDSNMNLISSNVNSLITYLGINTYYMDMELENESSAETVTTTFELRWEHDGERIYYNDEHNLLTHLHQISNDTYFTKLYYINNNGAGFYKLQISGNTQNGSILPTELGTISIYNDSDRNINQLLNKYPNSNEYAITNAGQDTMYVYLPRNGYFYIDVLMPSDNYGALNLTISPVESETINLLSSMTSIFTEDLTSDNNQEEYAKKLIINQTSKYLITLSSSDALSNNFDIIMFKQTYSSSSNAYYTNFKSINYITNTSTQKTFEVSLDAGVYFIYYYGNDTNVNIDLTLTRILQNNSNRTYAMQADPAGSGYNPGSEVRFNNGSRNNYTITEGFTRNIYFVLEDFYTYSRLDFDWYSSNENVATVSDFGTVFAKNVSSTQTVTIYAVYKEDPSLIYYRTFTVVDDTSDEEIVITCSMSYSYSEENGSYQIELTDDNSPYPMIQYYDWSVYVPCQETDITCSMNMWGEITASGSGYATLTGTYTINPRVTIIINLTITE